MKKVLFCVGLISIFVINSYAEVDCGNPKKCKEMKTCQEAKEYYKKCNLKKLDRDRDGIPCENVCK